MESPIFCRALICNRWCRICEPSMPVVPEHIFLFCFVRAYHCLLETGRGKKTHVVAGCPGKPCFFFAKFGPPILQKTPLKLAMLFVTLDSMRESDTYFFSSLVFLQIETWLTYGWCTSVAPVSKNQMGSLQLLATWEPKIHHPQYLTPGKQTL